VKHRQRPTYTPDIVGDIERWDEREILFARSDLWHHFGPDSPEFQAYYAAHPDHRAYDAKIHQMPPLGYTGGIDVPMFGASMRILDEISGESVVSGAPAAEPTALSPARAARKVKALAHHLGADLAKIGPLWQAWVYTHVGRSFGNRPDMAPWGAPIDLSHHTHAIALAVGMDHALVQCAPDFPVLLATAKGYTTSAWIAVQLAAYIRMMGYAARAHHFHNYQVLVVPAAVDCGLGELSRAGYLLTKEYGLAVRLAIVTTNMPLAHDPPVDIGVQAFCEVCQRCAKACPIGAIPMGEKTTSNGVRKWKLDAEKCYRYWHAVGTDCGICMAVCPWTKPRTWPHRLAAEAASRPGPHQRLMVWADKLVYGAHHSAPRPDFIAPDASRRSSP